MSSPRGSGPGVMETVRACVLESMYCRDDSTIREGLWGREERAIILRLIPEEVMVEKGWKMWASVWL